VKENHGDKIEYESRSRRRRQARLRLNPDGAITSFEKELRRRRCPKPSSPLEAVSECEVHALREVTKSPTAKETLDFYE